MDMALFDTEGPSEEGAWMPILDLDWITPIGADILLLGPDSHEAARITEEEERKAQRELSAIYGMGKKNAQTPEGTEQKTQRLVNKAVRLTKGWRNMTWSGEPFPYNEENARKLYTRSPHVRTQVLNWYTDRANFTKPDYVKWRAQFGQESSSTTLEKTESPSEKR